MTYHSMIQPYFTYRLLAWGNVNECNMNANIHLPCLQKSHTINNQITLQQPHITITPDM